MACLPASESVRRGHGRGVRRASGTLRLAETPRTWAGRTCASGTLGQGETPGFGQVKDWRAEYPGGVVRTRQRRPTGQSGQQPTRRGPPRAISSLEEKTAKKGVFGYAMRGLRCAGPINLGRGWVGGCGNITPRAYVGCVCPLWGGAMGAIAAATAAMAGAVTELLLWW